MVVTFRLDACEMERLRLLAEERGVSPHEYARAVCRHHMKGVPFATKDEQFMKLEQDIEAQFGKLRRNLQTTLEALLVVIGKQPKDAMREWLAREFAK